MEPPRVVHLKRTVDGRVLQDCDIYIGRRLTMGGWNLAASVWGNPYKLIPGEKDTPASRRVLLAKYETHVRSRPDLMQRLPELAGKTLGCFCAPKLCHGDVLVKMCREFKERHHSLLVTGSRSITDRAKVFAALDAYVRKHEQQLTLLIHGGAIGVDTLAGEWAQERGVPVKVVRPDFQTWPVDQFRWKAYAVRDRAMVDEADAVVAIWDGKSSGTRLTYEYAAEKGKLQRLVQL
jgi:hypothetical protein